MKYLHKDEFNAIAIIVNGHKGVTVQLITFLKQLLPNSENILEEHLVNHVDKSFTISVRDKDGKLNPAFKVEVSNAINQCQQALVAIQQNYQHIEGCLKDYDFNK